MHPWKTREQRHRCHRRQLARRWTPPRHPKGEGQVPALPSPGPEPRAQQPRPQEKQGPEAWWSSRPPGRREQEGRGGGCSRGGHGRRRRRTESGRGDARGGRGGQATAAVVGAGARGSQEQVPRIPRPARQGIESRRPPPRPCRGIAIRSTDQSSGAQHKHQMYRPKECFVPKFTTCNLTQT
jgi:hypothetical protein